MDDIKSKLQAGLSILLLGFAVYRVTRWLLADSVGVLGSSVSRVEKPFHFWVLKVFVGFVWLLLVVGVVSYAWEYLRSALGW